MSPRRTRQVCGQVRVRLAFVVAALVSVSVSTLTLAQSRKDARGSASTHAKKPGSKKGAQADGGAQGAPPSSDVREGAPPTVTEESQGAASGAAESDGGVVETKGGDGGVRVFRFGEVEIEGRLRSPQLVYFLRRVRAEFSAEDLGHRSFMGELSETRDEPNF